MNKKSFLIFFSLLCVMLISSLASASVNTTVITDPKNDVTLESWNDQLKRVDFAEGQSKPAIDIVSLGYGTDSNGNTTITLTLNGAPTLDNQTYYLVQVDSGDDNVSILAYAGAYSDSVDYTDSFVTFGYNGGISYSNGSALTDTNSITWTLSRQVSVFNLSAVDTGYYTQTDVVFSPNSSWDWSATAWTWTGVDLSSTSTQITSGQLWMDDTSASSTNTGSGTDTGTSSSLPSLDLVPVLGVLTVSAILTLVEKRKKKN